MKKCIIFLALFCCSFSWGQRKVILDTIQKFIKARIDDQKIINRGFNFLVVNTCFDELLNGIQDYFPLSPTKRTTK